MKRYLEPYLSEDLKSKIVLLTGPRQTGKTTLSKMLSPEYDYFNYDSVDDRLALIERSWDRSKPLIIFDELHKLKDWKSWLKGVYDTEGVPPALLVTGSAKLDAYRKVGDSLAGRFFQFRLHPLDLKEIIQNLPEEDPEAALSKLLSLGGFPEPYLNGSKRFYNRWKRSHLDIIIRQDLIDIENIQQIATVETLIQLLRTRVGSPVSYKSLSEDLQCSDKTIKRWLAILEEMYVIFRVTPFHKNIARSILKTPKFYFYDTGQVLGDDGARLENVVACALLKEVQFRQDCFGEHGQLHYLRNKDGKEIDFCVTMRQEPRWFIEVKQGDDALSPHFKVFSKSFPNVKSIQLVRNLSRDKTYPDGCEIRQASKWLATFVLKEDD